MTVAHPIEFPTFEEHIQDMFTADDISCMQARALDLSSYEGIQDKANQILARVKAGTMPPGRKWSPERVQTFENWIDKGYQRVRAYQVDRPTKPRLRKDIHKLSDHEIGQLKIAFEGLKSRDLDIGNKFSLFNLAGIHWYPGPSRYIHCRHHDNEYNPWHRAYLLVFENALRTVEGCEDVTLPYWDILGDVLPEWLFEEPFHHYRYPHDILDFSGENVAFEKGIAIHRYSATDIQTAVHDPRYPIPGSIKTALSAASWERFNGWSGPNASHGSIIEAHDNGHGACGLTITNPQMAAFDPLFWLFHCNWDRLWWQWQTSKGATDLSGFKATISGDSDWLDDTPANILKPFDVVSADMIDAGDWNVGYEPPKSDEIHEADILAEAVGVASAARTIKISSMEMVSVRVKNIDRLRIPGNFRIDLEVNGDPIRSTRIFQPIHVNECENCQRKGVFNKDFVVPTTELPEGAEIGIRLWQLADNGEEREVDPVDAGNPSVNIRYLLNPD